METKVQYFVRKNCSERWHLEPEILPFHDLTFVIRGSAAYYSRDAAHIVEAGQAIFLPAGGFRCAQTKGMECAAFNFAMDAEKLPFSGPRVLNWGGDEQLVRYFVEFERAWTGLDPYQELKCQGLFLLVLHRLLELSGQRENPHVTEIRRYLERHSREPVTVAQVAEYLGLHPVYCGALFKKETGMTIHQALNQIRVNRAMALLSYGAERVTDVAEEVGFSDLYYFSRIFKSITGLRPEEIRRGRTASVRSARNGEINSPF